MAKYLLPCSCGRKITVEMRHAGQQIDCECGRSMEVPTMLALRELEQVEEIEVPRGRQWGIPQALILTGLIVCLAGLSGVIWLAVNPLPPLRAKMDEETVRQATPSQTMRIWEALMQPLSLDIDPIVKRYKYAVFVRQLWMGIFAGVAVLGAAFVVGGVVVLKRRPPPAEKDPATN